MSRVIAASRSLALNGCNMKVISATRRVHSLTFPCKTKFSRSRAMSAKAVSSATNTARTDAAISLPSSERGQRAIRIRYRISLGFDGDADDIAFAVDGLDDLRRTGVVTENLAQSTHTHIDASVEGISLPSPQKLGELRPREHAVR
jgi:hypothetical protein